MNRDFADQESDLATMRRSDALRRRAMWRVLGVALGISLVGSGIATASHSHARGADYLQQCAVCQAVHQLVQAGDAVALPEPVSPRVVTLEAAPPSETPVRRTFHSRLSRAPPA